MRSLSNSIIKMFMVRISYSEIRKKKKTLNFKSLKDADFFTNYLILSLEPTEVGIDSPTLRIRNWRPESLSNLPKITQQVKHWQDDVLNFTHKFLSNFCASVIVELLEIELPDCPGLSNN